MRTDHGGNLTELARQTGRSPGAILDLSASINPLGPSARVLTAISDALPRIAHYPDPRATALVDAIAQHHGLPPSQVIAGNGSTELLYLLVRALAPRRALVVHPAFSEYEAALAASGSEIVRVLARASSGWHPDSTELLAAARDVDLVLLANPANPTGRLMDRALLDALSQVCAEQEAWLVVDEAFIDFSEAHSFTAAATESPRLAVVRSLTKFFAIPGLRLGYALVGGAVQARVEGHRQPWSVNVLAEAAGLAALADHDYRATTLRAIPSWRQALADGLASRGGFVVFPSAANFLLARVAQLGLDAGALRCRLLEEGVAIRDCASFVGLGPGYVRVAVCRPDQQAVLFAVLRLAMGL